MHIFEDETLPEYIDGDVDTTVDMNTEGAFEVGQKHKYPHLLEKVLNLIDLEARINGGYDD